MRRVVLPALAALTAYACAPQHDAPVSSPRAVHRPTPSDGTGATSILATSRVRARPIALPLGLTSFGAAKHGDRVYVLGGWMGEPHRYDAEHQSDAFMHAELVDDASWSSASGLGRVQSAPLVATAAGVIAIGGLVAHNATGQEQELESLDRVARFDPRTKRWEQLGALPDPRSSHDAVIVDGELWIVGGWKIDRDGHSRWHDTALHRPVDRPGAPWIAVAAPVKRRAHALVGLPGKLVVVGGMGTTGPTEQVDVLDIASGTWSSAPELPGVGFGVAAVALGDAVVASGADGAIWSWKPGEKAWRAIGRLAFPRFFHRMLVDDDGALLVIGGIAGTGSGQKIRATERVVIGRDAHLVQLGLDAPGSAKNRQGLLLHRDRLLVVGGNNGLEQHDFAPERFVDETWELELGTLAWHPRPALPVKRQSLLAITTSNDVGVVLGGFGHDGEVARTWSDGFAYDFAAAKWSALGEAVPGTRSQAGLVEHQRKLFLLGGLDYDPRRAEADRFRHPRQVLTSALPDLALRPSSFELPHRRRAFGGAVLDGEYVMIGGLAEGFAEVAQCESLALDTGKTRELACPSHARLSPELVAIDGRLLLVGGLVDGEPDPTIELYDPGTKRWRTLDLTMPLPIPHLRLLPWGQAALAFSAHDPDPEVHLAVITLPPRVESRP